MAKPVTTQQQQHLKFEDVSKYFNLPLSDAADSIGVSNTTLKKICLDNGLVRWPYRKILLGKSIEDIIKEAALEKKTRPTKDGKVDATKNTVSIGPVHEIPKLRSITQPTYKKVQTSSLAIVDEFRYGFPSNGLLRTSNKWWGSSTANSNKDTQVKAETNIEQTEQQSEKVLKSSPCKGEVGGQGRTDETSTSPQLSGTGLLLGVRKRALEEGQEALKLGFYQCSGRNKPGKREKLLLQGIFGSSLPKEWTDVSS